MELRSVVVVDAVRTPIGKYGGALAAVRPDDLAAHAMTALLRRTAIDVSIIEDVFWGAANQAGEDNRNVARMATLLAGLPVEVPGATVNRLCGSGLQAVVSAAREIQVGALEVAIAGGSESMTRAPYVMLKPDAPFERGARTLHDTTLGWRMVNPQMEECYPPISLGETAENVASRYGISREDQDAWALRSHRRAVIAQDTGVWEREIVPIKVPVSRRDPIVVTADEGPRRDTSLERLASLRPAFARGGTVTAGNSSQLNDGAAALLLMEESRSQALGLRPLARFVAAASAGVHPDLMGIGPIPATQRILTRLDLTVDDLDIVELNEAFASQVLATIRDLQIDEARVNLHGGSIALGHPLGASGARLAGTVAHQLSAGNGRYGLATMCIGVGQGISVLFEAAA